MTTGTLKSLGYAAFLAACAGVCWPSLRELVRLSLAEDTYSHILLIPVITVALMWMKRGGGGEWKGSSPWPAATLLAVGVLLLGAAWRFDILFPGGNPLWVRILALVFWTWAGFFFFFGREAFRSVRFPLLFLLLAVPLPREVVEEFIEWLRIGSAEVTYALFRLSGTPVLRHGYVFVVPGVSIDIAPECSGIRSAIALLITCLLAGYLFLRSSWARTALLVAALPVLVIKNGVRIVTLTLLAIHVDPGFLHGDLHRKGGFVFFLLGLLVLWPVLLGLQALEARLMKRFG
jgi:exosortase